MTEETKDSILEGAEGLAERTAAKARQRLQSVGEDLKAKTEKATEYARERYDSARENLKSGYGTAKDGLKQGYTKARKDMDQLADDVGVYVRDNPGRSVLIAAGIGFLIGVLVRPDRHRRS
jgi:ElaB/YqjD/DUF883 family membrane-anchored ribosome-binding protein